MKKIRILIWACVLVYATTSYMHMKSLKADNTRLSLNQGQLLSELSQTKKENGAYKIADSLSGIRTNELLLTISEYERYRQRDAALIAELTGKNEDLERVVTSQSRTIHELTLGVSDSIVVDTNTMQTDTLKCFSYKSQWYDVSGCLDTGDNTASIHIESRESLIIVETIRYKRLWGFLWKTNRIEDRQVNVVSENPNTTVVSSEVISIIQ